MDLERVVILVTTITPTTMSTVDTVAWSHVRGAMLSRTALPPTTVTKGSHMTPITTAVIVPSNSSPAVPAISARPVSPAPGPSHQPSKDPEAGIQGLLEAMLAK